MSNRAASRPRRARLLVVALPILALLVGTALTAFAVRESRSDVAAERDSIAEERAVASVTRRLDDYRETLTGLRGLFIASDQVSADEFRRFVDSGAYLDNVPGIEALVVAPLVRSEDGGETLPLTFRQPPAPELDGFDLNSQPPVRARIAEARREGMIVGNPPTELATGGVGLGIYEWVPGPAVVRAGCLTDTSARCADLRASSGGHLLLAVLRSPELLGDLKGIAGTTFSIADRGASGGPVEPPLSVFTEEDASEVVGAPVEIDAFGRRWELTFHSLGEASVPGIPAWVIGLLGMVATLALTVATYLVTSARQRAEDRAVVLISELADANALLEESNRDLQTFAFAASHDLQTPVRNVRQLAEILEEDIEAGDMDSLRENVALLGVVGERADELIQGLLAFSRVGSATMSAEPVDLGVVASDVRSRLEPALSAVGGTIEIEPLPRVIGDELLLRQAVENVVQNAIKYRDPDRRLRVRIRGERQAGRGAIHIEDNGLGIEERFHEKVFEMYLRLETKADIGGSGIGLALVKRIIERHGGRVELASEAGAGSTFSFILPEARISADAPARASSDGGPAAPDRPAAPSA